MQISACVQLEIKVILCLDPDLQEFVKRIQFKKRSISVLNLFQKMDRGGEKLYIYSYIALYVYCQVSSLPAEPVNNYTTLGAVDMDLTQVFEMNLRVFRLEFPAILARLAKNRRANKPLFVFRITLRPESPSRPGERRKPSSPQLLFQRQGGRHGLCCHLEGSRPYRR